MKKTFKKGPILEKKKIYEVAKRELLSLQC